MSWRNALVTLHDRVFPFFCECVPIHADSSCESPVPILIAPARLHSTGFVHHSAGASRDEFRDGYRGVLIRGLAWRLHEDDVN